MLPIVLRRYIVQRFDCFSTPQGIAETLDAEESIATGPAVGIDPFTVEGGERV